MDEDEEEAIDFVFFTGGATTSLLALISCACRSDSSRLLFIA